MAIISVNPHWRGRTSMKNEKGERSYMLPYIVVSNTSDDGPQTITAAVPWSIGQGYALDNDSDTAAKLVSISPSLFQSDATRRVWIVSLEFKTPTPEGGEREEGSGGGIASLRNEFTITTGSYDVDLKVDAASGKPITNSAGDLFDEPIRGLAYTRHWRITTYKETFDMTNFKGLINSLNNAQINVSIRNLTDTAAEKTALLRGVSPEPFRFENEDIVRVTIEIEVDEEGWLAEPLDAGFMELKDGIASPNVEGGGTGAAWAGSMPGFADKKFIEKQGRRPLTAQLLDGSGKILTTGATPVYLEFNRFIADDWAALNLSALD